MSVVDPNKCTADDVIRTMSVVIAPVKARLVVDETWLHEHGYHAYSTIVCNLRCKIEKAVWEAIEELGAS